MSPNRIPGASTRRRAGDSFARTAAGRLRRTSPRVSASANSCRRSPGARGAVDIRAAALKAWGYLRATRDVDVVPEPSKENLARLDTLLAELGGKVDVGGRLFEALDAEATDVRIDGLTLRVCSLEHLLGMKRASERPRDRDDVEALEAAQGDEQNRG
jgi:hypothetical protein